MRKTADSKAPWADALNTRCLSMTMISVHEQKGSQYDRKTKKELLQLPSKNLEVERRTLLKLLRN